MDVGFESAGIRTLLANEFDHDAAATWRKNRPTNRNAMVEGDINSYINSATSPFPAADIVFGGPPCQGFSVAGKMDPNDSRSRLVWSFLKVVEIVNPKVFVMENVAALGSLNKWKSVREGILERGRSLGYDVSFKIHHTPDYGVPENRDRVIFVGVREDIGNTESFYETLETHRSPPPVVRDVIRSVGRYGTAENPQTCTANVTLAVNPVMRKSPYAGMLVNGAGRPIDLDGIAPTLPASMGGNKTPIIDECALEDPSITNWFEVYHSNLLNGIATPTTTKVPSTVRRLTIKESAAIQTFPSDYVFCGEKTTQYRQIGNAVPCRFASAVARSIKEAYFEAS